MFGKNQFIASQHYDPVPFEAQVAAVGELITEAKASLQRALSTCTQNARRVELSNMLGGMGVASCAHCRLSWILHPHLHRSTLLLCSTLLALPCASWQVRHWGLSNETTFGVCKMAEVAAKLGVPPPISIQVGRVAAPDSGKAAAQARFWLVISKRAAHCTFQLAFASPRKADTMQHWGPATNATKHCLLCTTVGHARQIRSRIIRLYLSLHRQTPTGHVPAPAERLQPAGPAVRGPPG